MANRLAELGLDSRFVLFVMIDAAVGLVAAALVLSIWLSPTAGVFVLAIGSLVALGNFLVGGIPSALVWGAVVLVSKRLGASLRLACTIAASVTAVFASGFLFIAFGLWIGGGNIDFDGANALALAFAPVSILFAPAIAWKVYFQSSIDNKPRKNSVFGGAV